MKNNLLYFFTIISLLSNAQPIYFEDFNSGIPTSMTLTDVDGFNPASTVISTAGSFSAVTILNEDCAGSVSWFSPTGIADDWMVTPAITLPNSTSGITLEFDAIVFESAYPDGVEIYVSTTGTSPSDFTGAALYSSTPTTPGPITTPIPGNGENDTWTTRSISLTPYVGQTIYIAFRNNSNDMHVLGIDNIAVNVAATCPRPSSLTASNIGSASADISWTPGGNETSWNIEYGSAGFILGSGNNINVNSTNYTLTGLSPSTIYEYYVQGICSVSDSSIFEGPFSFSTTFIVPGCGDTFGPYCYGTGAFTVFTASALPGDFINVSVSAGETEVGYDNLQFYDGIGNTGNLLYDADGDHTGASVLSTTGTITMYIEGDATENCDVPGSLPGPLTPIELSVNCITPFAIDVAGISMNTSPSLVLANGPFVISGELQNVGSNTVTSMDINYSIDGGAAVVETVSGLSLSTGDNYIFNHGTTWSPNPGTYDIEIWATNINGSNDMNTSNDMATGTVTVFANGAINRPMLESFTSSTCGPCAPGNVNVSGVLQGYQNNQYSILKYQVDFPGAGDPYYTDEVGNRRTYYDVTGVPDLVVDGNEWQGNSNSLVSQTVDNSLAKLSFINLSSNYSVGGQKVDLEVTIDPLGDFTNLTLQAAIFEYKTFNNTGSNGETEFEYVMKKMVPNALGSNLNSLQDGVQRVENLSYTFNGNYFLPPNANSPVNHAINHTVEDFSNLGVIVWIQDDATKEILQSTTASLVTNVIENNSSASKLMIFPNPSSELTTLALEGFENSEIEINIINLLGDVVFTKEITSSSYLDYFNLDVSFLSNGIYNVVAKSSGTIFTKKLQILK